MQNLREAAFILSCSILVRRIGTVLIFAALGGVWYSINLTAFTVSSSLTTLGSFIAAMVGATIVDGVLVGPIVVGAMLRRIHKPVSLKRLGNARVMEEVKRLGVNMDEIQKSAKARFNLAWVVLGCVACLYGLPLLGVAISLFGVGLQLHFINQRLKAAA